MRVLFDTNVILDLLLNREPFAEAAADLVARVERGELTGFVGATTVTTIFYLAAKALGREQAAAQIRVLLEIFEVAPVNRAVLESALGLGFKDFEDAMLHEAARHAAVDWIVTRNARDFVGGGVRVCTPGEMLAGMG